MTSIRRSYRKALQLFHEYIDIASLLSHPSVKFFGTLRAQFIRRTEKAVSLTFRALKYKRELAV
jgi:hypothetical protein